MITTHIHPKNKKKGGGMNEDINQKGKENMSRERKSEKSTRERETKREECTKKKKKKQ